MNIIILRSICFDDEYEPLLITQLCDAYRSKGDVVTVYNMPACDNTEHWAGFALCDYSPFGDILICIDFPTALIRHKNKRIILSKSLPCGNEFMKAISQAVEESKDCFRSEDVLFDCLALPDDINKYICVEENYK